MITFLGWERPSQCQWGWIVGDAQHYMPLTTASRWLLSALPAGRFSKNSRLNGSQLTWTWHLGKMFLQQIFWIGGTVSIEQSIGILSQNKAHRKYIIYRNKHCMKQAVHINL